MKVRGFTLIEVMIAALVVLVIASVVLSAYSRLNSRVVLQSDMAKAAALIYRARSDTLAGRSGAQYGVHFESSKMVYFQGDSYSSSGSANESFPLSKSVTISSISLSGGGSEIIFQRLTGTTADSGSIKFISGGASSASSTLSVSVNGIVTTQ